MCGVLCDLPAALAPTASRRSDIENRETLICEGSDCDLLDSRSHGPNPQYGHWDPHGVGGGFGIRNGRCANPPPNSLDDTRCRTPMRTLCTAGRPIGWHRNTAHSHTAQP